MSEAIVLVPLDGTSASLQALPIGRAFAQLRGGTVHIVHVCADESRGEPQELAALLGLEPEDLEGTVVDARAGTPADEILRIADELDARYIVLSTHTASQDVEKIGATALEVVQGAICPVVLLRPNEVRASWVLQKLLVGHDGRPGTSVVVPHAAVLASRAGAELDVLHTATAGDEPSHEPGSLTAPRYVDQPQHEWPAWASEFLRRFLSDAEFELPPIRLSLAHGEPARELVRYARENAVDLIVLAWAGHWDEEHALTLKSVLREAPCPVMVVCTRTLGARTTGLGPVRLRPPAAAKPA